MPKTNTLSVGAEGADFSSLAEAVAAAPKGATIQLRPGRYEEDVTILQQLTISGDGNVDEIVIAGAVQVSSGLSVVEGVSFAGVVRLSVGRAKLVEGEFGQHKLLGRGEVVVPHQGEADTGPACTAAPCSARKAPKPASSALQRFS